MIQLDRNSKLIKWAYFLSDVPYYTSICPLFWRIVLITPIKIVGILAVIVGLVVTVVTMAINWIIWLPIICGIAILLMLCHIFVVWKDERDLQEWADMYAGREKPKKPSVVKEFIAAKKEKLCPRVEIIRSDD